MSAVERAGGVLGEQFYVTHCAPADSVLNDPGYTVRAASDTDPDALDAAFRYPPYELPIGMWRDLPAKAQSPRRLARTAHPAGGVWVAHSAYREKDSVDRERSYFSHLLHLPATAADPAAVLESWDAKGWVRRYPDGAPQRIRRIGLPAGRAISRGLLVAFLSRPNAGAADLSVAVCPARFHADVTARRDLVARFLQALLLVTAARDAGNVRNRLFVHAEPGLVAMLLYAAARVLPPHVTADLTFSTFEPAHRSLRAYTLATVVGTFLGAPGEGLDPDLATTCGYALDAVEPERSSPELSGWVGPPDGITALIDLAAEGRWDLLGKVHRRIGTGEDALGRVVKTLSGLRAAPGVKAAGPTPPAPATTAAAGQAAESGSPPPVEGRPASGSATAPPARPPAAPARPWRSTTWAKLWADKRVRVGAVAGSVLLLAAVALAPRSPNRGADTARIESSTTPVTLAATLPANPPEAKGNGAKSTATVPALVTPNPADAPGPMMPPDPIPAPGERPPPPAENPAVLTETVGLLAGLQLYQTYLNIGLLADARAERLYEAAEVALLLGSVMTPLEKVENQLEKVAGLKALAEGDAAAVARMRKVAGLLREQGKSLQAFWDTGVADDGKKYEEARQAAWKELSDLLQLDPKKDARPEPKPTEKP